MAAKKHKKLKTTPGSFSEFPTPSAKVRSYGLTPGLIRPEAAA
jgi:hypothetical protein